MYVTWTVLQLAKPAEACPWVPAGAIHAQAGHTSTVRAEVPDFRGDWWAVCAVWDSRSDAQQPPPMGVDGVLERWHVVLEPAGYKGDATMVGGVTPFVDVERGRVLGAAAVITLAGLHEDPGRLGEFLERFSRHGHELADVDGYRVAMVQSALEGAVLTFSAWETLRSAVTLAYHRPSHAETVRRHQEHGLVSQSGFLRCAVLSTTGTLCGSDPLAGLTGTVQRTGDDHG